MEKNHAKEQAKAQLEGITDLVNALKNAQEGENDHKEEAARQAIQEDALEAGIIKQYFILLCTGGPACRIIGNLDEYGEPETARIQFQDWGTPWTDYPNTGESENTLLEYARQFYFGEEELK